MCGFTLKDGKKTDMNYELRKLLASKPVSLAIMKEKRCFGHAEGNGSSIVQQNH